MEGTRDKLNQAWLLRYNQKNEESYLLFVQVCDVLSISHRVLKSGNIEIPLSQAKDRSLIVDTLALSVSLGRSRGAHAESLSLLGKLESYLENEGIFPPYSVLFERGLFELFRGDYSSAEECFVRAGLKADNDFKRLAAGINTLLCLENQGLGFSHTLSSVEELFSRVGNREDIRAMKSQWRAFHLRQAFRQGDFEKLFHVEEAGNKVWDQARYFQTWVSRLPYVCHGDCKGNDAIEDLIVRPQPLFRKNFKSRTLQGMMHPDDMSPVRWADWSDRLYLWVWNWLVNPEGFPLQRVMVLLRLLWQKEEFQGLTVEDSRLVTNAFLWLGLFDPHSARSLPMTLQQFQSRQSADYSLLDLETLVVRYFLAVRDKDDVLIGDYLEMLRSHPLWNSPQVLFRELVESVNGQGNPQSLKLKPLIKNLKKILGGNREKGSRITVDFSKHEIRMESSGDSIICEFICRAMDLMWRERRVRLEDFCAVVFGITSYDPVVHEQRVFRLLRKMKDILSPQLNLRTKSGFIICEGDWSGVLFRERHSTQLDLMAQSEWKALVYGRMSGPKTPFPEKPKMKVDTKVLSKTKLNRKEFEQLTGKSRSSANRIIQKWEKKGWLKREGFARATKYCVSDYLKGRLRQGDIWL